MKIKKFIILLFLVGLLFNVGMIDSVQAKQNAMVCRDTCNSNGNCCNYNCAANYYGVIGAAICAYNCSVEEDQCNKRCDADGVAPALESCPVS